MAILEFCYRPRELFELGDVAAWRPFGWRGPWGTTYAPNLRLLVDTPTGAQWLAMARSLKPRPPMPWFTLNEMHEENLRALYEYMRHLGPAGEPAPAFVPPDQEPPPPYATFPPPPPQ